MPPKFIGVILLAENLGCGMEHLCLLKRMTESAAGIASFLCIHYDLTASARIQREVSVAEKHLDFQPCCRQWYGSPQSPKNVSGHAMC